MHIRIVNPWFRLGMAGVLSALIFAPSLPGTVKPERLIIGAGLNEVLDDDGNPFGSIELRFSPVAAQLRPWIYGSLSTEAGAYVGAGLAYTFASAQSRWSASVGFGPGYYHDGDDVFLGGDFEMLSFAEIGYRLDNDAVVSVRLAHLSNGSTRPTNPGTELLSLQYSIPLDPR
ncbi:MAG: acyloxyacyl hydrolase [Verrucomicrobiota bacterium]